MLAVLGAAVAHPAIFGELIQTVRTTTRGPKACRDELVDDRCGAVPFRRPGPRPICSQPGYVKFSLRLEKRLPAPADVAGSAGRHQARRSSRRMVPSSALRSWRLPRRKPRAEWSAITARTKVIKKMRLRRWLSRRGRDRAACDDFHQAHRAVSARRNDRCSSQLKPKQARTVQQWRVRPSERSRVATPNASQAD